MAWVCEELVNEVCMKWTEEQATLSDLAITGDDANWLVAQIVAFWVLMFLLREIRKRLF